MGTKSYEEMDISGNKALTQENNTLAVKWLVILLPVFQML